MPASSWRAVWRAGLLCLPLLAATPAYAGDLTGSVATSVGAKLDAGDYVWTDDPGIAGPVSVIVSLTDQRAYVYRGATLIGMTSVSSGKPGHETPIGTFTILQKQKTHRSTLYDSAPMPYMQRLTWDGVALHAGSDPGYPTSHGCVHLPLAFAKKLFAVTRLGATVEVTDASYAPPVLPLPTAPAGLDEAAQQPAMLMPVGYTPN